MSIGPGDPALEELAEVCRGGELVVVAGEGVSVAAGLPSRERIVERLLERARERGAGEPTIQEIEEHACAGRIIDALSAVKEAVGANEFCDAIERALDDRAFEVPAVALAIAALSPRAVLTTNLDLLLERAFLGRWPALATAHAKIAQRRRFMLKALRHPDGPCDVDPHARRTRPGHGRQSAPPGRVRGAVRRVYAPLRRLRSQGRRHSRPGACAMHATWPRRIRAMAAGS